MRRLGRVASTAEADGTQKEAALEDDVENLQEETEVAGTVGSVHGEKSGANSSDPSTMCHLHAHNLSSPPLSGSLACGGSSVGFGGAPGWARGRASARLSSSWCCPGCGLYGDGTLCMTCDTHGVENSGTGNSIPNLRAVRSREPRGGTKTLRTSSGVQVGSPILDNASGDAGLADYLRWAPRRWPIEAWECRLAGILCTLCTHGYCCCLV